MGINIWRLQTNTDSVSGEKVADICLRDNVVAMGWSLKDSHLQGVTEEQIHEIRQLRDSISTFDDYKYIHSKYEAYNGKVNDNIMRLYAEMCVNDLVWMRNNGQYYLGRVCEGSTWFYNSNARVLEMDASNQRTNVQWYLVGDESDVPGAIATAMIRGKALQRISKTGVDLFSMLLYNRLADRAEYQNIKMSCDEKTFYSLLSSDDCEDLLCAWLYSKYGYIAVPSTNKKSTELYECVLKDPATGNHIYPQVKNEAGGVSDIDIKNYLDLDGEIWLFSTYGLIQNQECITQNVHIVKASLLFDFVTSGKGRNYLPDSIIRWHELMLSNS